MGRTRGENKGLFSKRTVRFMKWQTAPAAFFLGVSSSIHTVSEFRSAECKASSLLVELKL
jgi:hypothetical protein